MSDSIDRQATIEEAKKLFEMGDCYCDRASIVGMLNSMPSTEKTGKWIEYPIADGMNQCSACGVLRFGESNYCPNCGARMEE